MLWSICTIDFLSVDGLASMFRVLVDEITVLPDIGAKELR
jgi:hypothetical protein